MLLIKQSLNAFEKDIKLLFEKVNYELMPNSYLRFGKDTIDTYLDNYVDYDGEYWSFNTIERGVNNVEFNTNSKDEMLYYVFNFELAAIAAEHLDDVDRKKFNRQPHFRKSVELLAKVFPGRVQEYRQKLKNILRENPYDPGLLLRRPLFQSGGNVMH